MNINLKFLSLFILALTINTKIIIASDVKPSDVKDSMQTEEETHTYGTRGGLLGFCTITVLSMHATLNIIKLSQDLESEELCSTEPISSTIIQNTLLSLASFMPVCSALGAMEVFSRKMLAREDIKQSYLEGAKNGLKVVFLIPAACYLTCFTRRS